MSTRVVVTGLGTVTPNANSVDDFGAALRTGRSGIRADEAMAELGFASRVSGVPEGTGAIAEARFPEDLLRVMNLSHRYAAIAALDAWSDAGFEPPGPDAEPDWDTGTVLGTGVGGMDTTAERVVPFTAEKRVRRLGSTAVEQVMASGVSARVSGLLALGNQATTNSSACSTGAEAVAMGAERIRNGQASRMLCG
ncbi:MAG: beta-ketoacyl synthase N-terminal-like domain-containing protein, partial [Myxococcota bacterium]